MLISQPRIQNHPAAPSIEAQPEVTAAVHIQPPRGPGEGGPQPWNGPLLLTAHPGSLGVLPQGACWAKPPVGAREGLLSVALVRAQSPALWEHFLNLPGLSPCDKNRWLLVTAASHITHTKTEQFPCFLLPQYLRTPEPPRAQPFLNSPFPCSPQQLFPISVTSLGLLEVDAPWGARPD